MCVCVCRVTHCHARCDWVLGFHPPLSSLLLPCQCACVWHCPVSNADTLLCPCLFFPCLFPTLFCFVVSHASLTVVVWLCVVVRLCSGLQRRPSLARLRSHHLVLYCGRFFCCVYCCVKTKSTSKQASKQHMLHKRLQQHEPDATPVCVCARLCVCVCVCVCVKDNSWKRDCPHESAEVLRVGTRTSSRSTQEEGKRSARNHTSL